MRPSRAPMSDIFISYSSKDRPWVERFAKVLESRGWSVWWDRNIPTGESFDTVIKEVLQTAKCVIVVWSQDSVDSDWVKAEADEAKKRKVLLPIRIDEVSLPLGFTRLQTQSLSDWKEGPHHPGFKQLLIDIARVLGAPPPVDTESTRSKWRCVHPFVLVGLPTVVVGVAALMLMQWRIPTRVQLEITAERVAFTVVEKSNSHPQPVFDALDVRSLAIEGFSTITFEPERVEIADPDRYDLKADTFPASAWTALSQTDPKVSFNAPDETRHPKISVDPRVGGPGAGLRVDAISLDPGATVTLETTGEQAQRLTVKVSGQRSFNLPVPKRVELVALHLRLEGVTGPRYPGHDELTYRVLLRESGRWLEVAPVSASVSMTFASNETVKLLSHDHALPVTALDLTRLDKYNKRVSALTAKGTLTYPDYPDKQPESFTAIDIDGLSSFNITKLSLNPDKKGLNLIGIGSVGQLLVNTGGTISDRRLTAFESLKHNLELTALFAIVVWVFPTTLGAYRLYKEFKR